GLEDDLPAGFGGRGKALSAGLGDCGEHLGGRLEPGAVEPDLGEAGEFSGEPLSAVVCAAAGGGPAGDWLAHSPDLWRSPRRQGGGDAAAGERSRRRLRGRSRWRQDGRCRWPGSRGAPRDESAGGTGTTGGPADCGGLGEERRGAG